MKRFFLANLLKKNQQSGDVMKKKKDKTKKPEPELNPVKALNCEKKICHQCGTEVTHRKTYKIFDRQCGVIEVCSMCQVKARR